MLHTVALQIARNIATRATFKAVGDKKVDSTTVVLLLVGSLLWILNFWATFHKMMAMFCRENM